MSDYRKKKDRGEPAIQFRWDPLELASDKTFSTTIRIFVSGWWPEERPTEVSLSCYEKSQQPSDGNEVRIQKGEGTFPLAGLEPGRHYHVVVYIGDRTPVQKMIMVPELAKPPSPEQEALERERTELERAKVAHQLKQEKEEDKEPRPTDFTVEKFGGNGKYKLLISVFSKEKPESIGVGIPKAAVTVVNRHTGQSWETKTDFDGTVIFEVPGFTEREKIITIAVKGLPFVKDRQLLGPSAPVHP